MKAFAIRSILAPTDLSDSSLPAMRYARLLADRFAANLTVLYTDPVVYPIDYSGLAGGVYLPPSPEHEAELLWEVQQHADAAMAGRPYAVEVTLGQPAASILRSAKERHADLIVTGTHLRHGWRRAILGSVSEAVLHGSECPVLTVASRDTGAGAAPHTVTHVLCPVNFTIAAREALRVAVRFAEVFGAHLTIVHALEQDQMLNVKDGEERVRRWVAPELQDVVSYREVVVRGGAAERVLDCAEDFGADLLVIGAQHKLFRDSTVIGTTTERLIRFASCPVLVVPRAAVKAENEAEIERELVTAGG